MAWNSMMKNVAVKTIGTVEAGMDYSTIHAPDTLSLGIGQWAMERAYDLLMRFSNKDFGPTINSWIAQGRGSWTYSARQYSYLTGTDRSKLKTKLASAEGQEIQNTQMVRDFESTYIPRCQELGMDINSETEACIFLFSQLHQYGTYNKFAPRIVAKAGAHPISLDRIYWAAQQPGCNVVGEYPGRYNLNYRMIKNRETIPGFNPGGGNGATDSTTEYNYISGLHMSGNGLRVLGDANESRLALQPGGIYTANNISARKIGSLLLITTPGGTGFGIPCGGGYYTVSGEIALSEKEKGNGGGGGAPSGSMEVLLAEARASIKKYAYYQREGRLYPDRSGITDCSGFVWYLYKKYFGIDIGAGGTSVMINYGGTVIAEGSGSFNATNLIRAGDLIVCRWWSGGGHVELCMENGSNRVIGQRGPDGVMGPDWGSTTMFGSCNWKLKRYM